MTEDGRPALLGTLFLSFREPRRMSAQELSAARTLGGLAALAIANARLHARALSSLANAEQRAALDPLTGLANHRTFHERLRARGGATPTRDGRDLALVLIDIDHFKQVNDTYGHQAGDRGAGRGRRRACATRPATGDAASPASGARSRGGSCPTTDAQARSVLVVAERALAR